MKMKILFAVVFLAGCLGTNQLFADPISLTFSSSTISGLPGSTLQVEATLTNTSAQTVFINFDNPSTVAPFLTVDDNPFFANAPLSLDAGASSGPINLFNVLIGASATPGVYDLNSFSLIGGADSGSFDLIGSQDFTVMVQSNASPVPEPSSFALFASGILLCASQRKLAFSKWRS